MDSKSIVRILKDELNWQNPVDKDMRFDCSIHCLANYHYLASYGISHDGVNRCNFIRENELTREEVMAKENAIKTEIERECKEIIERIGLKNYRMP
jgi:hypothetical protein